jgi:hypothetical protein
MYSDSKGGNVYFLIAFDSMDSTALLPNLRASWKEFPRGVVIFPTKDYSEALVKDHTLEAGLISR